MATGIGQQIIEERPLTQAMLASLATGRRDDRRTTVAALLIVLAIVGIPLLFIQSRTAILSGAGLAALLLVAYGFLASIESSEGLRQRSRRTYRRLCGTCQLTESQIPHHDELGRTWYQTLHALRVAEVDFSFSSATPSDSQIDRLRRLRWACVDYLAETSQSHRHVFAVWSDSGQCVYFPRGYNPLEDIALPRPPASTEGGQAEGTPAKRQTSLR